MKYLLRFTSLFPCLTALTPKLKTILFASKGVVLLPRELFRNIILHISCYNTMHIVYNSILVCCVLEHNNRTDWRTLFECYNFFYTCGWICVYTNGTTFDPYQQGISLERKFNQQLFLFSFLYDRRWSFKNINVSRIVLMEQGNILVQLSFHISHQVSVILVNIFADVEFHQLYHGSHFDFDISDNTLHIQLYRPNVSHLWNTMFRFSILYDFVYKTKFKRFYVIGKNREVVQWVF